jgi:LacI family transcriptional regulator
MQQQVTMSDVARRAGVTRATVSFVINQRSKDLRISAATQRRVLAAIASLNYRVNSAAQSTSRGRSYGIGVMTPGGSKMSAGWCEQVEGIHRAADELGYHVVYVGLNEAALANPLYTPKMIQQNLVDGVIFLISGAPVEGLDRTIRRYHIPTIWIQRRRKFDAIFLDEGAFARASVEHLLAVGHRRICLLDSASELGTLWSRERRAAFEEAMRRANATARIVELSGDIYSQLASLLDEPHRSTAFLANAPSFASHLLMQAHVRGLRVPQDFAVISIANAADAASTVPPLTRWDNELQDLGFRAGKMLVDRIEKNAKQPAQKLTGHLVPAGTTVEGGDRP